MRHIQGTRHMSLRFDLLEKDKDHPSYRPVLIGSWITPSDPSLGQQPGDTWDYDQRVTDLQPAPAVYRFRVHFRWTGADGRPIGSTIRFGQTCFQPELRPDLQVGYVRVEAIQGKPNVDRYLAPIGNRGATGAGPFEVSFSDGSVSKQKQIDYLGPHRTRQLSFVGPACTSSSGPTITADRQHQVNDYDRSNNSVFVVC